MNSKDMQDILGRVQRYLDEQGIDYRDEALAELEARKKGKRFIISDHIRAILYAQLSNQTRWRNIAPKLPQIAALFFSYNKDEILAHPTSYYIDGLLALKCGNISTRRQMARLHDNIRVLERIEKEKGDLDAWFANTSPQALFAALSKEPYKLHYLGTALIWEYLRGVGIDGAKPDLHLRRLFGAQRLGVSQRNAATEAEVLAWVEDAHEATGYARSLIDNLLWYYCADDGAALCGAKPKCAQCVISAYCSLSHWVERV